MRERTKPLLAGAALVLAAAPGSANAGSASGNMAVSATVIASCEVTAAPLAFGDYDPISSTPLDAATTVSVTCTNGSDYDVAMGVGDGAGASISERRMTGASGTLAYSIYRDSGRNDVWGETINTNAVAGTGTGAAQTINVYGRVPAQQTAEAGAYADTIVVTVTY